MPSGTVTFEEDTMDSLPVSFVSPDEKYLCVKCHDVLREPKQTLCGHRLCKSCVDRIFIGKSVKIPCPAGEGDCAAISIDEVLCLVVIYCLTCIDLLVSMLSLRCPLYQIASQTCSRILLLM